MKPISALIALALIVGVPLLAWMIWAAWTAWAAWKQKHVPPPVSHLRKQTTIRFGGQTLIIN